MHVDVVGVKFEVERVAGRVDRAAHVGHPLVVLQDIGVDEYAFALVVPVAFDVGNAQWGVVVGEILHVKVGCMELRCTREERRRVDIARGASAKHHVVDIERFKHIFEVDVLQLQRQRVFGEGRNNTIRFDKLVLAVHVDAVHVYLLVGGYAYLRTLDVPNRVVDGKLRRVDAYVGLHLVGVCQTAEQRR